MAKLYLVSEKALEEFKKEAAIENNKDFYLGNEEKSVLSPEHLVELKDCYISDDLCQKMLEAESKDRQAVVLYESLNITPLLASDERLWVYLSHGPLSSYVAKHWSTNIDKSKNFTNHVLEHWFIHGHSRIMRSELASLWWGVEISKLEDEEDKYRLTKILFSNYTLRVVVLAQVLRSRNVLRGILEWFYRNGTDKMEVRGSFIAKYLNQLAGIKQLTILSWEKIVKLIEDVQDVIFKIKDKNDYQNLSVSDIIYNIRNPHSETL